LTACKRDTSGNLWIIGKFGANWNASEHLGGEIRATVGNLNGIYDTMIEVVDLTKTYNDPLAAKVRSRLREEYGFTRNTKRSFGIECVFSRQQPVYPKEDGTVSHQKPGIHGVSLDCRFGYGTATHVTASFGFMAVARVIQKSLKKMAT